MAAIFDKPLPSETPPFLDPLSPWKHLQSMNPLHHSAFAELRFGENRIRSPPPSESPIRESSNSIRGSESCSSESRYYQRQSENFSSMNSESLSMCTEGLGFESFDDVDDMLKHDVCNEELERNLGRNAENHRIETKVSARRRSGKTFPPPISCIGRSGKPWVCFKSYREDGRFILKEIRIPTQEFLHACRENGRLKLQFIQSDDEILEEDEEEDEEKDVENRDCNFNGGS